MNILAWCTRHLSWLVLFALMSIPGVQLRDFSRENTEIVDRSVGGMEIEITAGSFSSCYLISIRFLNVVNALTGIINCGSLICPSDTLRCIIIERSDAPGHRIITILRSCIDRTG